MDNNEIIIKETGEVHSGMDFGFDNIKMLAERADENIKAINKIMKASIAVTNENDWVLIGGAPYLQETGATKIARLFGVSWTMEKPEILMDNQGFKTYIFKGTFTLNNVSIEAEGSRSMKDDFFTGKGEKKKSADEIDERDVRMSAYTNCINNGIKRLIPGVRNVKLEDLTTAGLDTKSIKGYTFKEKKEQGDAQKSGPICSACEKSVTQTVASFSQGEFGRILCISCQKKAREKAQEPVDETAEETAKVEE